MKSKTVIYCRVSTDKQSHEGQQCELREYCQRQGWENVIEIVDTISGGKFQREGLDQLMTMVRAGKVDRVVCFKLDRLGRSLGHLAQIIGELTSHQVALIIPSQGINTESSSSNPAASLQLNILCAVAQFEKEIIKERVSAGITAARRRGVSLGRPSTSHKHLPIVSEMRSKGMSVRSISKVTSIPMSTVLKLSKQIPAAALNG